MSQWKSSKWPPVLLMMGAFAAVAATPRPQTINAKSDATKSDTAKSEKTFHDSVQPFVAKNCLGCHSAKAARGGLVLEDFTTPGAAVANRSKFELVLQRLEAGEMPPKGMKRPSDAEMGVVTGWLRDEFARADAAAPPNPGRVTARRLNRTEYNNTVRDLLGIDFQPANDFPQDDSGYGFDNIGDALSLSPVLMGKYLSAAEKVSRTAIFGREALKPTVVRHQPPYREGSDGGANGRFLTKLGWTITDYDVTGLTLPSSLHATHNFPVDGQYEFRISPEGNRPLPSEPFKVVVWIDGKPLTSLDFEATTISTGLEGRDKTVTARVPAGTHWVAVSALRQYEGLPANYGGLNPTNKPALPPPPPLPALPPLAADATPEQKADYAERVGARAAIMERRNRPPVLTDVTFRVNFVEIAGPFKPELGPSRENLKRIFICQQQNDSCARTIVSNLAKRAYRRPVTPQEVNKLMALVAADRKRGATFKQSIGTAVTAVLVSPNFLFRIERDPMQAARNNGIRRINSYELASRLSYFLWSSMPDGALMQAASDGSLSKPAGLNAQVKRMLKDPKAVAFAENFGGQWLGFRALESVKPDPVTFMAFNDYLRLSMQKETQLFLQNLIATDGSVMDLLNGRYTFINEQLARFYNIPGVKGPDFRRVSLEGTPRAGILTQASVLTMTSYATRTSVVQRGKWVLENLLNASVPPPPPNVPAIDEAAVGASMSLRQQMEQHRANPVCASCHARMDPIGFGLENFDAIGRWRTTEGKFPIDASGVLPNGQTFSGPDGLRNILMQRREAFIQAMTEKMMTYALGRGLETYDRPAVKAIAKQVEKDNGKVSSMVLGIVNSLPFQARKAESTI